MQKKYKIQSAVGLKSPSYGATENGQDRTVHFRAEKKKKMVLSMLRYMIKKITEIRAAGKGKNFKLIQI